MQALLTFRPMPTQYGSARQRLLQAALQLFATQGISETTTRQIADLAEVNEVTLFRNFGSKQGLLLAVIEAAEVFTQPGEALGQQIEQFQSFAEALQTYAEAQLQALEQIPEFVRSLVGEAGRYSVENRQAIGRGLTQIHHHTVHYLTVALCHFYLGESVTIGLTPTQFAGLINTLLLGYTVLELTTEFHELWQNREEFIADLVKLFLLVESREPVATALSTSLTQVDSGLSAPTEEGLDLPAPLVRAILQQARQSGLQDYALTYVLFGAGLSPGEVAGLQRSQAIFDQQQHLLQVTRRANRQIPLNQWIMRHRYGSYIKNPLTQWLKSRKDQQPAMFITTNGEPLSEAGVRQRWQEITAAIATPGGQPPAIEQAQHTWRVEMLLRGISLESLSLLSDCPLEQLQPYEQRAREKAAQEEALRLDQRPGKAKGTG